MTSSDYHRRTSGTDVYCSRCESIFIRVYTWFPAANWVSVGGSVHGVLFAGMCLFVHSVLFAGMCLFVHRVLFTGMCFFVHRVLFTGMCLFVHRALFTEMCWYKSRVFCSLGCAGVSLQCFVHWDVLVLVKSVFFAGMCWCKSRVVLLAEMCWCKSRVVLFIGMCWYKFGVVLFAGLCWCKSRVVLLAGLCWWHLVINSVDIFTRPEARILCISIWLMFAPVSFWTMKPDFLHTKEQRGM